VGFAVQNRLVGDTLDLFSDALHVDLPSGGTRLIFNSAWHPRSEMDSPAGLKPGFTTFRLISAVTSDGINWTIDPGARTAVSSNPMSPDTCYPVPGKAIKRPDGTQLIYLSCGAFITKDGLELTRIRGPGRYLEWGPREPDAEDQDSWAEINIVLLPDGRYRMYKAVFYAGTSARFEPERTAKIFSYISNDGFTFTKEPGVRIPAVLQWNGETKDALQRPPLPCLLKNAGHPIVYRASDGKWIMFFKNQMCVYNGPPPGPPDKGQGWTLSLNAFFSVATSEDGLNWTVTEVVSVDDGFNTGAEPYAVLTSSPEGDMVVVYSCLSRGYDRDLNKLLHSGLCIVRRPTPTQAPSPTPTSTPTP